MNNKLRSDILSENTIRKVMPSCLIYALVQSMTFMVDTIVSGHFLGKDAVAAVALGMPLIGMMLAVTSMIMHGGFLKMLDRLGKSDMDGYNRIFSITLTFTILLDIVFVAICVFATESVMGIVGGAKASAQAAIYGSLYIKTACLMILFFAVGTVLQLVSTSFGYQTDRMVSSIVNIVVNIIVSVVAIQLLSEEYKIAGLGIGSAAGAFGQMATAYIQMKRRRIRIRYRLYAPNKQNILDSLDCMRRGLPASIDTLLDSVSGSAVNNIILSVFANGTSVLALVAIMKTLYTFVRTIGRGSLYASEPLMGILDGERDNHGICSTFKASVKTGCIYAIVAAAAITALQRPILSFYGVIGTDGAALGLMLIAASAVLSVFLFMFNAAYEATDHLSLSLVVGVIPDSILYPIFTAMLGKTIGVTGVWLAMGYSFIPFFIVYYFIFMLINKKLIVPLERLLVLKKYENRYTAIDVSIPVESEHVSFVSERLQSFFLEHNTSSRIAYISALCMEELAADYLQYRKRAGANNNKSFMDIKAFRDPDKIEIILRNYDDPYDPLIIEKDKKGSDEFSKIGVIMTQRMASEILYSYAYHLNIVSITIPTSDAVKVKD